MKVGDKYVSKNRNPFDKTEKEIVDVKDGWCKYICYTTRFEFWSNLILGFTHTREIELFEMGNREVKNEASN